MEFNGFEHYLHEPDANSFRLLLGNNETSALLCYFQQMKVVSIILIAWVLAVSLGFSDFASAFIQNRDNSEYNYCEKVRMSPYRDEYTIFYYSTFMFGGNYLHVQTDMHEGVKEKCTKWEYDYMA